MTSSNVSNLLVQVSQIDVSQTTSKPDVKNSGLFEKTLSNVAGSNSKLDVKPVTTAEKSGDSKTAKLEKPNAKKEIKQEKKPVNEDTTVVDKVEAVVTEVKEVIAEKLDVSEEDIETAMETLGLTGIDLLTPQNLAQLVAELTGESESITLVMSDDFAGILDKVTELSNQLFKETNFSFVEIKELFIQMDSTNLNLNEISDVAPVETKTENADVPELQIDIKSSEEKPEVAVETMAVTKQDVKVEEKTTDDKAVEEPVVEFKPVAEKPEETKADQNFDSNENNPQPNIKTNDKHSAEPIIRNDNMTPFEPKNEIQFSVEEQVVELPTGETVKAEDIMNQLIEKARVLTSEESTTMEMTLNPEGLGKIFLEVTQKGNEITAKIFTENDAVKQALENQMANFRIEMNQNATKVTSIEVSVGTHEFERNLDENTRQDSQREEQAREQSSKRRGRIDVNSLDDLSGVMTEEELLVAQMMRDNGGTLDFMA